VRLSNGLPLNALDVRAAPRHGCGPSLLAELREKYCDLCPSLRRDECLAVVPKIRDARLRKGNAVFPAIPLDPETDPTVPADILRGLGLGEVCAHPDKAIPTVSSTATIGSYTSSHLRAETSSQCSASCAIELTAGWWNNLRCSPVVAIVVGEPITSEQILVVAIFAVVD
jgi:hypothetical protein